MSRIKKNGINKKFYSFNYMSTEYLHPTTHSVSPVTPNYVRYEKGRQ